MDHSKHHNNWLNVGEIINLIRQPVVSYADKVVETIHKKLCQDLATVAKCTTPGTCLNKTKSCDLCYSCKTWYKELAALHLNTNKYQIKWRKNCDTSKWPDDAWEVAKFFMSILGDNKSTVKDAESTDLSSLLNVLEWMKPGVTFNLAGVRSDIRNAWAHAPKHEMSDEQLENAFVIASKFLEDLAKVFVGEEVNKCLEDIQFLQQNKLTNITEAELKNLDLLRKELCGDVSRMKAEIRSMKEDHNSDRQVIQDHENELKILDDRTKECCSKMEEFQKWKEGLDELYNDVSAEFDCFRNNIEANIAEIRAELQDAKNVRETQRGAPQSCLPEKLSTFTARDTEVKQIISFLVEKSCGIVSIVGGPGFGKSTIALEVSHRLSDKQPGIPVIFSHLSIASTMDEAINRLCLDVGVHPVQGPEASLIFWARNIKKKVILVMDNIDKLLEFETRSQFNDLVSLLRKNSNQQLLIITTSRTVFSIPKLSIKSVSLREMDADSSMELLRKNCPNVNLEDDYLKKLAELCGHIPLALCIAASRIQDFEEPNGLITCLEEQPMKVLNAPERNQYVEKAFKMSFEMLSDNDKISFVQLSVFNGNFGQDVTQKIINRDKLETHDFLKNIMNRSLLQASNGRFLLHLLVKRFLMDYHQDERKTAQELMVEHYLKLCHSLTLKSYSKDGFNDARESLKKDAHNIEETFKVCCSQVTTPDSNVMKCLERSDIYKSSARFFYNFVGNILPRTVIRKFLQCCRDLAKKKDQPAMEINFQCLLADQEGHKSEWKSTEYLAMMKRVKEEFDKNKDVLQEDTDLLSHYYFSYSRYLLNVSDPDSDSLKKADDYVRQSLNLRKNQEEISPLKKVDKAITQIQLGRISRKRTENINYLDEEYEIFMSDAKEYYKQALESAKACLGDHELTRNCHKNVGDLLLKWQKNEEALEFYKEAKKMWKRLGLDPSESIVNLLNNYGRCFSYLKQYSDSLEQLHEACDMADNLAENDEPTRCRSKVYRSLAEISYYTEDVELARKYALKAIEMKKFFNERTLKKMEEIAKKGHAE